MKNALKDTGHLRNCTAFEQLVLVCSSIGNQYRPSNPAIAPSAISDLSIQASQSVNDAMSALNNYYAAVDRRVQLFSDLRPKATRVVSYFRSCGTSKASISNLVAYNRKLQGRMKVLKDTDIPTVVDDNTKVPVVSRSSSQRSFDQQAQHFLSMVDLLVKEPSYQPLEDDLTVARLTVLHQQLLQSNLAVTDTERSLSVARNRRNELLYADAEGLVTRSKAIKAYIKAAFGIASHEYELAKSVVIKNMAL